MVMRIVFLGTPEFAIPTLRKLLECRQEFSICGVFTQPDRPAGRGRRLSPPPVKKVALERGLPVFQPARLRQNPEAISILTELKPDLLVVVAYGLLLPSEVFEHPSLGTLNVHASLLPKYRGAAPVVHALLNGETETGVTIMKIDEGMDTGDILSQVSCHIGANEDGGALSSRLASLGAELLVKTIPAYARGELKPRAQDHSRASYAPKIGKRDGRISWAEKAEAIHNRIRAMNPWPVAYAGLRGETVKIWRSSRDLPEVQQSLQNSGPGSVIGLGSEGIEVACGQDSRLLLTELQWPSRKRLPALDFINGIGLKVGELFV